MNKQLFFTVILLFLSAQVYALGPQCGIPLGGYYHCADGSMTWTCCGAKYGYYDWLHPFTGCDVFCGDCKGGCRKPENLQECEDGCERGYNECLVDCVIGEVHECESACDKIKTDCDTNCEKEF